MEQFWPKMLLHEGPLLDWFGAYERLLTDKGYSYQYIHHYIRVVADFSAWLKLKKISAQDVTYESAHRYLRYRARYRRPRKDHPGALERVVQWLQQNGIAAKEAPVAKTATEQLLNEYSLYLLQERGLATATIFGYTWRARLFLAKQPGAPAAELSSLGAGEVIKFVQSEAARLRSAMAARTLATGLRSFLRYARYRGYIKLDLAAAVPKVACWAMTSIPKGIAPNDARRALASCDRRTAIGRRDYAMLLLLIRLGLRAGEVASLTLDDIDWKDGTLTIHGKGNPESSLPLLAPVGRAIAAYLKNGRPHSQSRRVFLCKNAPIREFKNGYSVVGAVGRALDAAGIDTPRKGAHQFRHALATHMLSRGSSLAEIGEILRHKSPNTTQMYAKVDLKSLRALTPPWPSL